MIEAVYGLDPISSSGYQLAVIRRRAGIELMECLELAALFLSRGGWAVVNRSCYPNKAAYQNAISRLRKSGLIVKRSGDVATPQLILTDAGQETMPVLLPNANGTGRGTGSGI